MKLFKRSSNNASVFKYTLILISYEKTNLKKFFSKISPDLAPTLLLYYI